MKKENAFQVRFIEALPVLKATVLGLLLLLLFQHSFRPPERSTPSSALNSEKVNLSPPTRADATQGNQRQQYGHLPLIFEANRGQTDAAVKFLSRGPGYRLFLTPRETVLVLSHADAVKSRAGGDAAKKPHKDVEPETRNVKRETVVRMKFLGANPKAGISGLEELPGKSNYFIGNDRDDWKTNIPHYSRVKYSSVYPGIDLIYYGAEGQLEYDLVVAPQADPGIISIKFDQRPNATVDAGSSRISPLEIDSDGDLLLHTASGDVRQHKPRIYQEVNGGRREVAGHYVFKSKSTIGFQVVDYDRAQSLVLDPALSYSTYLGGSSEEVCNSIALDSSGNAYVTGKTLSTEFPTANALQRTKSGDRDVFITKLNPQGSALIYSTFLGGDLPDQGYAIAVDPSGNVYVTGSTLSTNFPTVNAFQTTNRGGGGGDAFVAKLAPSGSALIYSTYLGGTGDGRFLIDSGDRGRGVAADSAGNAYVLGNTDSANFPTRNPFQTIYGGGDNDAFVAKFDPSGGLIYSTFLGGSGKESSTDSVTAAFSSGGNPIAADSSGNAYLTGTTSSTNFPTSPNAFQPKFIPLQFGTGGHAFVTKINASGSALLYSTFLGGSRDDAANGIAVDSSGSAYVTGKTSSPDFPVLNAFRDKPIRGFSGYAFVTKINPAGSALLYSTYLGGGNVDEGKGIALDPAGNIYLAGQTTSLGFPLANPIQSALRSLDSFPKSDVFVTKFNPSASKILFSTYLGGSDYDFLGGIAADSSGSIYVAGSTRSTDFPTARPFQGAFSGGTGSSGTFPGGDAFVSKIDPTPGPGELLAPVVDAPWTRSIRIDSNQNGVPDPDDETVNVQRIVSGQTIALRFISPTLGTSDVELSNPNAQGRYQTAIRRQRTSSGTTKTTTVTLDQFDANQRAISVSITHEVVKGTTTTKFTGKVTAVDENGDGIIDYLTGSETGQPAIRGSLVYFDVNGDGKPDFASIPWAMSGVIGASTGDPQVFVPLADTNGDGIPDSPAFDFDNDGKPDPEFLVSPMVAGRNTTVEQKLYFAQFGDGAVSGGQIVSQISLFNPDTARPASAQILIRDDAGNPITVALNGEIVSGQKDVTVPPGGLRVFRTSGTGPLTVGSVSVTSDKILAGVIVFGGSIGFTGVGSSAIQFGGFVAPIETNTAQGISTGIAMMNLESSDMAVDLQLVDSEGQQVATSHLDGAASKAGGPLLEEKELKAGGHLARFVQEFSWTPQVDFSNFSGTLRASFSGRAAATVLKTQPGQLTTLPVAPILVSLGLQLPKLYFAQFGDGAISGGQIVSQISLFNLDTTGPATVSVLIRDDSGKPITVALNGETVSGQKSLTIPAGGLRVLRTPGTGPLTVGSVTVTSDRLLGGVIVFGGSIGFTGVGSSAPQFTGFLAPIETNSAQGTSTGVAIMNLETSDATADLQLLDSEGRQIATSRLDGANAIKAGGHLARFVTEFTWSPPVDFSNFSGVLKVTASGRVAATVLKTQPGQLTTLPVAPKTN